MERSACGGGSFLVKRYPLQDFGSEMVSGRLLQSELTGILRTVLVFKCTAWAKSEIEGAGKKVHFISDVQAP